MESCNITSRYYPLIAYIVISVVWIMIFAISGAVFMNSNLAIFLSVLWVVIYIPVIIYYVTFAEISKAWYIVTITFLTTLLYLFYITAWLLAELMRRISLRQQK